MSGSKRLRTLSLVRENARIVSHELDAMVKRMSKMGSIDSINGESITVIRLHLKGIEHMCSGHGPFRGEAK